ncbi:MAG: hypothetical protein FJ267_03690, partial [Planctomycetes bacterium]|nr:hypothetical protein [Planctomycetota bacterium]
AQHLWNDPLFKTIVGIDPRNEDQQLASGSTLNRFGHAFTRREAEMPLEQNNVLFNVRKAQVARIIELIDFLVDVFIRTREQRPVHGQQQLTFRYGCYEQNPYFPMMIFDGETEMPLGAWLGPGTVHASCGAVEMLKRIVDRLRQH